MRTTKVYFYLFYFTLFFSRTIDENESIIIPAFVTIAQSYVNTGATQVVSATKGLGLSAHKPTDPATLCYPGVGCD